MSQRTQRVNQLIKEQIGQLLLKEIDFGSLLVTITEVTTSTDLSQAKIKISVMPTDKEEQALRILRKNIFQLQQRLNKKMTMKIVPKIIFEIDQAEVKSKRIEEILGQMKKD